MQISGLLLTVALAGSRGAMADTLRAVETPLDALAGTAAIVEGSVQGFEYTFDAAAGPRTIATLTEVVPHFGRYSGSILKVATLGGPINATQGLFIPELPRLTENTRYLIFLNNIEWFYSPVVESYLFRIEKSPSGKEVLIAPSGHAVMRLSEDGIEFTPDPVVDTRIDFLNPNARLRLLDTAPEQLETALAKSSFLATIGRILATTPLQGEFPATPDRTRVWNKVNTAEDLETPQSAAH
ncbi:MAG TPA: hypothetical protein VIW92_09610 [Thermoanaerobaculia bacterium]